MHRLSYIATLFREVVGFARRNKAYWIVPLVLILALLFFLIFAGQASAPFIYTLF